MVVLQAITYRPFSEGTMAVYLGSTCVGHIVKNSDTEFYYLPRGQKMGAKVPEMFATLLDCQRSLESGS